MFEKIKNYLILKSSETTEEHLCKIVEVEKYNRKIKLRLIDEKKNIFYKRNKEVEVLIPHDKEVYYFKTFIIFYDVIEKIITIEYPKEVDKETRRKHTRYDINVALDIIIGEHTIPSISFDISLGGMAFIINNHIELNNIIPVKIKTEDLMEDDFRVKIINKRDFRYKGKDYLMYSGEFYEMGQEKFDKLLLFFAKTENIHKVERIFGS